MTTPLSEAALLGIESARWDDGDLMVDLARMHRETVASKVAAQMEERITTAILAAWLPQRDTESVLIRCALRIVATELGIDLDAALAGPAEVTKEAAP